MLIPVDNFLTPLLPREKGTGDEVVNKEKEVFRQEYSKVINP
jgi:hypothetical protein